MKIIRVIYFGYDIKTLFLLDSDKDIEITAVAIIPDLLTYNTYNPVDSFFKIAYQCHIDKKYESLKNIAFLLYCCLKVCSSSVYKKYSNYFRFILRRNISVVSDNEIKICNNKIDLFIVNNWWLLSKDILSVPLHGCINIHPSKLPQYRGALPTLWSLKNGDKKSAVSYILLNDKMDAGGIISQHLFDISECDDSISLEIKIDKIIECTLVRDMKKYLSSEISVNEQDNSLSSTTATFYEYMKIDFESETAKDIYNKVRLYPYLNPVDRCYFYLQNKRKIKINGCAFSRQPIEPGVVNIKGFTLYAGCNTDILEQNTLVIKLFKNINLKESIIILISNVCCII